MTTDTAGDFLLLEAPPMDTRMRIEVPPQLVRDVQRIAALESSGFLPADGLKFDADRQVFVLEMEGDAVAQALDLMVAGTFDRGSETWSERMERQRAQRPLQFGPGEG